MLKLEYEYEDKIETTFRISLNLQHQPKSFQMFLFKYAIIA